MKPHLTVNVDGNITPERLDRIQIIVNLSGGAGSFEALRRLLLIHPAEHILPLFADTLIEDEDLYRFLNDIERVLNINIVRITRGLSVFDVWHKKRAITVQAYAPCSDWLKREPIQAFLDQHQLHDRIQAFGMDWNEQHRIARIRARLPNALFPLAEKPYIDKEDVLQIMRQHGIEPPRLYAMGFSHNNCGGGCVKAGKGAWRNLLLKKPDWYARWEAEEKRFQDEQGFPNATILKTMSLRELREQIEQQRDLQSDMFDDMSACGCFVSGEE